MNATSRRDGYLSIIQFMPEPMREEAVNVGVVVFDTSRRHVVTQMTDLADAVRARFPELDIDEVRLASEKRAFARRLEDLRPASRDDIVQFLSREAGRVTISSPRAVVIDDVVRDADDWFNELVERDVSMDAATCAEPIPLGGGFVPEAPIRYEHFSSFPLARSFGTSSVLWIGLDDEPCAMMEGTTFIPSWMKYPPSGQPRRYQVGKSLPHLCWRRFDEVLYALKVLA